MRVCALVQQTTENQNVEINAFVYSFIRVTHESETVLVEGTSTRQQCDWTSEGGFCLSLISFEWSGLPGPAALNGTFRFRCASSALMAVSVSLTWKSVLLAGPPWFPPQESP